MSGQSFGAKLMKAVKLLLLLAVIYGGWKAIRIFGPWGEGNATLSSMAPGGILTGQYNCWLTMEFRKCPPGIDPKDVRVVFTSDTLANGPETFDWSFIAKRAMVPKKSALGRERASNVSAEAPPPMDFPFDVNFPLTPKMTISTDKELWLTAELYWGGRKQDEASSPVRHLYRVQ